MQTSLLVLLTSSNQKPVPAITVLHSDPKALHQFKSHLNIRNGNQLINDFDLNISNSERSCHEQCSKILTAY